MPEGKPAKVLLRLMRKLDKEWNEPEKMPDDKAERRGSPVDGQQQQEPSGKGKAKARQWDNRTMKPEGEV